MSADCDLLIVGAGPVGASLAAALAQLPLRVVLADARPADDPGPPRTLALTLGSLRILEACGALEAERPPGAPIRRVHVSDHGHFGRVVLDAASLGAPLLGSVVTERELRAALLARSAALHLMPGRLVALEQAPEQVEATFDLGTERRQVSARLVVAADGTDSTTCALAGLRLREQPTGVTALVGRVRTLLPHAGTAHERFTDTGPVALLPTVDPHQRHFVWSLPRERAQRLAALPARHLLALLAQRFGERAGRFEALEGLASFVLRTASRTPRAGRVLAVGNAAHTLHPVAAQGFNLGLRDVAALADLLAGAARAGQDVGAAGLLERYVRQRRGDWFAARSITRYLPVLFEEPGPPLSWARSAGLTALELAPLGKRLLLRTATGLLRPRGALARGTLP